MKGFARYLGHYVWLIFKDLKCIHRLIFHSLVEAGRKSSQNIMISFLESVEPQGRGSPDGSHLPGGGEGKVVRSKVTPRIIII